MPKPNYIELDLDEVAREIEAWPAAQSKPKMLDRLNENDRKALCLLMRSGKKMQDICAFWESKGKAGGTPNTMRSMFRELVKMGY